MIHSLIKMMSFLNSTHWFNDLISSSSCNISQEERNTTTVTSVCSSQKSFFFLSLSFWSLKVEIHSNCMKKFRHFSKIILLFFWRKKSCRFRSTWGRVHANFYFWVNCPFKSPLLCAGRAKLSMAHNALPFILHLLLSTSLCLLKSLHCPSRLFHLPLTPRKAVLMMMSPGHRSD